MTTWTTHVIDNADHAANLLYVLLGPPGQEPLVSLDTETTGCNPKKESPVQRARLFCMTLAWRDFDDIHAAFVTREWVPALRAWLESDRYRKVGQNIFGYDRHVLKNEGIKLRGIEGDTLRMSKLLNPAKTGVHGLKEQARALGLEMTDYTEVMGQVWHGKEKASKTAPHTPVNFEKRIEVPIDVLWETEWRRPAITEYAVKDAVAGLLAYENLTTQLQGVQW